MSLAVGTQLGPYQIVAPLGVGGMGEVYKARDSRLDRLVAVKVLPADKITDPERKRRFVEEAKAASALNHPHIVTIHDISSANGVDFIVMEYVPGKTLDQLIPRRGLRTSETLKYAIQIADALAKAHGAGIVHRDLKPANLMVTDDGQIKVLDFGLAKLADAGLTPDDPTRTMRDPTEAGTIVGTIAYMSPEQAEGKAVDARSDIFSFGAVLYEMLTGQRAFSGESKLSTLSAILHQEPKPVAEIVPDVPRDLAKVVQRCLRKDPARRFQHMADLAVELDDIKTDSGTQMAAARAPARTHHMFWFTCAAAAVAVAVVGGWLLWPKPVVAALPTAPGPLTSLPGDEGYPTLSRDGNQVAFAWNGEKGDNTDIYVLPVGAGTPIRITTDPAEDYAPAWSPDGRQIAFMRRQGGKTAVYLTPPVPGSERKVAEVDDLPLQNGQATASWLPDGTGLVTRFHDGTMDGIVVIPLDHGESKRLVSTSPAAGAYNWPTISPRGDRLAYAVCASDTNFSCDVYVTDLARDLTVKGTPRRLTDHKAVVFGIAWADSGRSLVYGSGGSRRYLWQVPVGGGPPQRLEIAGDHAMEPAISAQAHTLAYTRASAGADIWKLESNGSPQPFLSSTLSDLNPQFSPDGRRIAFESNRLKDSQIWVANADGTNPAPLNDGATGIQGSPHWSPDSRWIAHDGQGPDGRQSIYVVDAAGGQPRLLTTPGAVPSWSHDGAHVYFVSRRTGRAEIWRVPAAGGTPVQMTDAGGTNVLESPDGKTLYYTRSNALYARPLAGGPERQIVERMAGYIEQYFPVDDGIYYMAVRDPATPFATEIRFLSFSSGKAETVSGFESRFVNSLSVSPDRKTILLSGIPVSAGDDLMLIRNFR